MVSKIISVENLGKEIEHEKKVVDEISSFLAHLNNADSRNEKSMIQSQLEPLIENLRKTGQNVLNYVEDISLTKPLSQNSQTNSNANQKIKPLPTSNISQFQNQKPIQNTQQNIGQVNQEKSGKEIEKNVKELTDIETLSIKRLKEKEEEVKETKKKRPSAYVKLSSKYFYKFSSSLLKKDMFKDLKRDLIKGNLDLAPAAYISMVFFSTLLSFLLSVVLVIFLTFFTMTFIPPSITFAGEEIGVRFLQFFWIIFVVPLVAFTLGYGYPSLERKSLERKIDRELPFATIHMSAISNSMIEPSKIFGILISTGEYPNFSKELIKLQNEINVYGYDLVTALKNRAFNSPSRKMAELFNGLATTITSGGDLPVFFDKRSQSLLFEYRLDVEKQGKAAETFMDIYISVVIAAPMVLMLLLMMMSISGLGLTLSPGTISLIMILAVTLINIMFLAFLHLRQPEN